MSQDFQPGDYLVFQLESGYGLLRLLGIDETAKGRVWHISAFNELFPDVEFAEMAISTPNSLTVSIPHHALTTRAFESTQVAKIANTPLAEGEVEPMRAWHADTSNTPSDRSVRLLLGLR